MNAFAKRSRSSSRSRSPTRRPWRPWHAPRARTVRVHLWENLSMQTHPNDGAGFTRLGDVVRWPLGSNANAVQKFQNALAFGGKEGSGEPSGVTAVDHRDPEGFARYLA